MKEEQISYKYKRNEDIQMIITKTPFRMSFFGGGTDIENEKMKRYLDSLEWDKVTKKMLDET